VLAQAIVGFAAAYAAIGLAFAIVFAIRGIEAIDPVARNSGWTFRFLVVPGAVALWPLLAKRWWLS
jgi:hypothetical protein